MKYTFKNGFRIGFIMGIFDRFKGGNILYYPGCLIKYAAPELEDNYKEILERVGVDFIVLKELEKCCGSPVLNAGFKKDFEKLVEHNKRIFDEHGINKLVTNCPGCFHIFEKQYQITQNICLIPKAKRLVAYCS